MSVALAAIVPITPAFAQSSTDGTTTTVEDSQKESVQQMREQNREQGQGLKQQIQTNREQKAQERCQNVQTRLNDKLTQVQNNKKNFGVAFTNMKARLQRLSDRLAAKNIDVTKLNEDIATLGTKIDKLNQDHDNFLTNLQATISESSQDCVATQGQFMSKLSSSRSLAKTVEQDRLDIRNFFQSTIRPDIMAIRKQIESNTTEQNKNKSLEKAPGTKNEQSQKQL